MTTGAVTLAVSDLLVMSALDKAAARVARRGVRVGVPDDQRHRVHERIAVPQEAIDKALAGAWALCPLLASRHRLPVPVSDWVGALDTYTRSLLLMSQPHSTGQLAVVLERVLTDEVRVGAGLHVVQ